MISLEDENIFFVVKSIFYSWKIDLLLLENSDYIVKK